ncbi:hypothetical protein FRC12_001485 [Ceratobasidium sp. 428]|nr:hypothetical protein FRC12_001485 [Ceratobasidium sp. 428]
MFANPKIAHRLRKAREAAAAAQAERPADETANPVEPIPPAGDMVFESGILFFNISLRLKNFIEAIKSGCSDRVVASLKTLALAFRGTRHTKYAYESMVFLHNYLHVWPAPLRSAIARAWLVNTSGNPNSSKPADLMQEHLNLQIKTIYKAHGSNESWEWLAMIAPCVAVLRRIAREFHTTLGDRQGTRHSSVSIEDDIQLLATSLRDHRVYELVPGRAFDPEDTLPKDVISEGYRRLAHGSKRTIDNYNDYFKNLQKRFKISPLSSDTPQATPGQHPAPEENVPGPEAGGQDDTVDPAQDQDTTDGDVGATENARENDDGEDEEDDVSALFDWDHIEEEDIAGLVFSDEDVDEDEESESDEDVDEDEDVAPGEEFDSDENL